MTRVFVSFSHQQGQWVFDRLVPVLKASGVEVLIDTERFRAGYAVKGEMDRTQDEADRQVLVITEAYLQSDYCQHELKRALALHADFTQGLLVPVRLDGCQWPGEITVPDPLYMDLRDDQKPAIWKQLLDAVQGDLGTTALDWLQARDELLRCMEQGYSVNLVVNGEVHWHPVFDHLCDDYGKEIAVVDLENPATFSRQGLVREILEQIGSRVVVPPVPDDMAKFQEVVDQRSVTRVALTHFDLAQHRVESYGVDFFAGLRYMTTTTRKLVLIVQSRSPLEALLPKDHLLSNMLMERVNLGLGS